MLAFDSGQKIPVRWDGTEMHAQFGGNIEKVGKLGLLEMSGGMRGGCATYVGGQPKDLGVQFVEKRHYSYGSILSRCM